MTTVGDTTNAAADESVRARLALALDVDDIDRALALARDVREWFGIAKIGLELWSVAGRAAIDRLRDLGLSIFADLKLHDIPTTVGRTARVLGSQGVSYLNFHAAGGTEMLRAGVDGLLHGAAEAGHATPVPLGVTVLTSDSDTSAFETRLAAARAAGCGGVVCSIEEVARVRAEAPEMITVVPGLRLAGGDVHDQARVGTPADAARAGADILVVGRAVTAADDPRAVARVVADAVRDASAR